MKNFYRSKWGFAFQAIMLFIINLLIQTVIYIFNGEFNLGSIIGAFTAAATIIIINAIYVYFKKDKTPEVDERVLSNIIKYTAYASQIIFLILMIILTVISFMGIESIPIMYLWIIVLINMFVIGIGNIIVSKR